MGKCCCASCEKDSGIVCPICGTVGQSVPFDTVKNLVKESEKVIEAEYSVCLDAECDVVYFGGGVVFCQDDVTVPVAWKTGAAPRFICYCNKVTYDQVLEAVIKHGARTTGEIARLTGAMKNGNCKKNNPKGMCCHVDIEKTIAEALKQQT